MAFILSFLNVRPYWNISDHVLSRIYWQPISCRPYFSYRIVYLSSFYHFDFAPFLFYIFSNADTKIKRREFSKLTKVSCLRFTRDTERSTTLPLLIIHRVNFANKKDPTFMLDQLNTILFSYITMSDFYGLPIRTW